MKNTIGRQIHYYNEYVYGYWGPNYVERYTSDSLDVAGRYETNFPNMYIVSIDVNNNFLFAGGHPGIVFQWDLETQTLVHSYKVDDVDNSGIVTIKLYKQFLIVASEIEGERGVVDIWNLTTGNKIRRVKYVSEEETTMEVAKDVLYIVTGTKCNMYNVNSGMRVMTKDFDEEVFIQPIPSGEDPDVVYFCINSEYTGVTVISYNHNTTTFGYMFVSDHARVIKIHENYIYYCSGRTLYMVKSSFSDDSDQVNLQNDAKDVVTMDEKIDTFVIGANNIYIKTINDIHIIPVPDYFSNYEEDSDTFTNIHTDSESIHDTEGDVSQCLDQNLIMLEPYTQDDNPLLIYLPNSKGKFSSPNCTTKEEFHA
jgi:WD40 repeat protein